MVKGRDRPRVLIVDLSKNLESRAFRKMPRAFDLDRGSKIAPGRMKRFREFLARLQRAILPVGFRRFGVTR